MKHKLLKLNVVLMLGLGLAPLQGQTTMNVKATSGYSSKLYGYSVRCIKD